MLYNVLISMEIILAITVIIAIMIRTPTSSFDNFVGSYGNDNKANKFKYKNKDRILDKIIIISSILFVIVNIILLVKF